MGQVSSRRKPYPYWSIINGVGVMLEPNGDGLLVGQKVEMLEGVVPNTYEYSSLPPFVERVFQFRRLILGMGERVQSSASSRRYYFARNADLSIGGMPRRGPLFHAVTPSNTGEIRQFINALHGGAITYFALAGQYVIRRVNDSPTGWTNSHDFGAGRTVWQAARFKEAGGSPIDSLYAATDNKQLFRYNGSAWSAAVTNVPARCLAVLNDELWRGWDNQISKVTADPTVDTNWSAPIQVGDSSSIITWMEVVGGQLFVFKENGHVYSVNTDGTVNDLDLGVQVTRSVDNGRAASVWFNKMWAQMGDSFYAINPGATATFSPVGPERMIDNQSPVRGKATCSAGHQAYFLYVGVYNPDLNESNLLKHGSWVPDDNDAAFTFLQVYHGSLKQWADKRITAMSVVSPDGGNERLYAGFSDGSIEYAFLPSGTPDPMEDDVCEFTSAESFVRWPSHTAMFQADTKVWNSFASFGPVLDDANYVQIRYSIDGDAVFHNLGTNFTSNAREGFFPEQAFGRYIDIETVLVGTPVLEGMALKERVAPALRLQWDLIVRAQSNLGLRNGQTDRRTATAIKTAVKQAVEAQGNAVVILPDGTKQEVGFIRYQEIQLADPKRYGLEWRLPVRIVQYRTNRIYGTWDRARAYTWNPPFTWDNAGEL